MASVPMERKNPFSLETFLREKSEEKEKKKPKEVYRNIPT